MLARLRSWAKGLLRRSAVEREMADEMRFHLESRIEDLVRSGLPRLEAERDARLEFGSTGRYTEECRQALGLRLFDELRADCRYAARSLRRSPSFAVAAILTLALAIGLNTAFFTVMNLLVLRPIPVRDPWSLYQVVGYGETRERIWSFSQAEFEEIAARSSALRSVIADATIRTRGPSGRLGGYAVSGGYFSTLGAGTLVGRPLAPSDDSPAAPPVVVLGHLAWRRHFAGDESVVGRTIELGGRPFTVAGVASPEFTGMDTQIPDFWVPLAALPQLEGR